MLKATLPRVVFILFFLVISLTAFYVWAFVDCEYPAGIYWGKGYRCDRGGYPVTRWTLNTPGVLCMKCPPGSSADIWNKTCRQTVYSIEDCKKLRGKGFRGWGRE